MTEQQRCIVQNMTTLFCSLWISFICICDADKEIKSQLYNNNTKGTIWLVIAALCS